MIDAFTIKQWQLIHFIIEMCLLLFILWHIIDMKKTITRLFQESELVQYLKKISGQ